MTSAQDKYKEMMTKLQEAREFYLQGLINLDELVFRCARIGVDEVTKITKNIQLKEGV